jgi:hypothetical protein
MVYLPQFNNVLIGVHLSFVEQSMDGWSYRPNTTGEQFRFYLLDLTNGKVDMIHSIESKHKTGPPIPNIIMQPNPKKNSVLVHLLSLDDYYMDLAKKRIEKISIKVENYSEMDSLNKSRLSGIVSSDHSIEMRASRAAQWSSDGTKIGAQLVGGFMIIKIE